MKNIFLYITLCRGTNIAMIQLGNQEITIFLFVLGCWIFHKAIEPAVGL